VAGPSPESIQPAAIASQPKRPTTMPPITADPKEDVRTRLDLLIDDDAE
jgi:hypothetical protein